MPHDVIPRADGDAVIVEQLAYLLYLRGAGELSVSQCARLDRVSYLLEGAFRDGDSEYPDAWQAAHPRTARP